MKPAPRGIATRWRDSSGVLPAGPRFQQSAPRGIKIGAAPPQRTAHREEIKREQGREKEIPAVTMEPRRRL
jgi:hypothetical protein